MIKFVFEEYRSLQVTLAGIMKDGDKQAKQFTGAVDQEAVTVSRMISN